MFGQIRRSPFEDIFNFRRDANQLFNQFWGGAPSPSFPPSPSFTYPLQVHTDVDGWRVEIPMPGIDPAAVTIEAAGHTVVVRAEHEGGRNDGATQWEQTLTVPRTVDLDGIRATHRHGMLVLTMPLIASARPRRIPIDGVAVDATKQLTTA